MWKHLPLRSAGLTGVKANIIGSWLYTVWLPWMESAEWRRGEEQDTLLGGAGDNSELDESLSRSRLGTGNDETACRTRWLGTVTRIGWVCGSRSGHVSWDGADYKQENSMRLPFACHDKPKPEVNESTMLKSKWTQKHSQIDPWSHVLQDIAQNLLP